MVYMSPKLILVIVSRLIFRHDLSFPVFAQVIRTSFTTPSYLLDDSQPTIIDDMVVDDELLDKVNMLGIDSRVSGHGRADLLQVQHDLDIDN